MIRSIRTQMAVGLTAVMCVVGLAACSSTPSSPSAHISGKSPPPGAGDTAICQLVTQATMAYNAKNYTGWRSDMVQIGNMAGSAQYEPVKTYADAIHRETTLITTTTTRSKKKSGLVFNGSLALAGGYVGLQHACANLPSQG